MLTSSIITRVETKDFILGEIFGNINFGLFYYASLLPGPVAGAFLDVELVSIGQTTLRIGINYGMNHLSLQ